MHYLKQGGIMVVIDCLQGSESWIQEKLGKPSASNANQIITSQGKQSKQREGYMYTLAAERVSGQREETFKSAAMEVGNEREQESRDMFEMMNDCSVQQVGVIYKDEGRKFLSSPDGIVKNEYGLELKNVLPKTQVKYLLKGTLPTEYFVQVQFSLYVTGFKMWQFCSYSPGLKPLIIPVMPDDGFIASLDFELKLFLKELDIIVDKIK